MFAPRSARTHLVLGVLAALAVLAAMPATAAALGFVQAPGSPYGFGSADSQDVATGDLNGDGRDDVVSVNWGPLFGDSPGYSVMLANANGSLSPAPGGAVSMSTEPYRVGLGNFDGDSNLDLAMTMGSSVDVYLGNGDGTFAAAPVSSLPAGPGAIGIAVGRLNGDAWDDIVVTNMDSGTVSVFWAFGGTGSFTPAVGSPISVGAEEPIAVAFGDLDGNGFEDIVTANRDDAGVNERSISLVMADDGGAYETGTVLPGEYVSMDIALGNVDAGPTLDIVTVSSPNNGVVVKLGNGNGTFTDAPGGPFDFPSRLSDSLVLADLDADGRDDVSIPIGTSIGEEVDSTVWVFGSAADGSLSPVAGNPFSVWSASYPDSIAAGDFNDDGTPDLVTANGTDNLTVLLRDDSPQPDPVMGPEWLDFGEAMVGQTSAQQDVTIANNGPGPLLLSTLYLDEESDQYAVNLNDCPAQLEQGEECTAHVTFSPTSIGGKSANVRIPRALGPPATVSLYGWGEAMPSAELTPTSHDFGTLPVGEGPDGTKTFFVASTSAAWFEIDSVELGGADPGEFEIEYNECEEYLLDGEDEYCEVDVSFDPDSTVGPKTAELIVESSELDAPLVATLSGEAEANPGIFVSPGSWNAGNVEIGGTSATERFEVFSYGATPTQLGAVELSGADSGEFAILSDGCSGESLGTYDSCEVEVEFAPGTAGAKTATLVIPADDPEAPHQVSLEGTGEGAPGATLTPTWHDFEGVPFNTSSESQAFTLESTGSEDLEVDSVVLTEEAKGFQKVSDDCSEAVLAPGESCVVEVLLKPQSHFGLEAEVQFETNAADPQPRAELTGYTFDNPGITVTPMSKDFGELLAGSGSEPQEFEVENSGTTELLFSVGTSGPDISEFSINGIDCMPEALQPGESCVIEARFNPVSGGPKAAEIVLDSNAGEPRVELSGFGMTRTLSVTPPSADLGDVPVGETSVPAQITVENTGNSPAQIESLALASGDTEQFSIFKHNCVGALAAGATCSAEVTFSPTEGGEFETALAIGSNATNGPWSVPLSGTGVATPNISLHPASHDFGNLIVGAGPSSTHTFTVESTGSGDLELGTIELTGTDPGEFTLSDNCPATLAPTSTCAIEVAFDPSSEGQKSAQLSVASDAPGSPDTASVAGFGIAPNAELEIGPPSHDFGELALGSTGPGVTFTVESTGNVPVTIGSDGIGLSGMAGNFVFIGEGCVGDQLTPGQACDVEIAFEPTELGAIEAELLVYSDAGGPPAATASLTGTGLANPGIAVSPTSLAFGSRTVGDGPSAAQAVAVESTGTTPLEIEGVTIAGAAAAQFELVGNHCIGLLGPGEGCQVAVAFAPTAEGAQQAQLEIAAAGVDGPLLVDLSGTGTAKPAPPTPPTPPAPVPPAATPAPPACTAPAVKQPTVFVPTRKETPKVPGLRARFGVAGPVVLEVSAKLRYRANGKARSAALGKQTLRPSGSTANYKVAIPARLRETLVPGTAVKLELRYRSRGTESTCTEFGPAQSKNLATKVVWIKP